MHSKKKRIFAIIVFVYLVSIILALYSGIKFKEDIKFLVKDIRSYFLEDGKDFYFYAGLNNYSADVNKFDLKEYSSIQQEIKKANFSPVITGSYVDNKGIWFSLSTGKFYFLNKYTKNLKEVVNFAEVLNDFHFSRFDRGLRGFVFIEESKLAVFYSGKNKIQNYTKVALFDLDKNSILDEKVLANLPLNYGGLGGGMSFDKYNKNLFLAHGVASNKGLEMKANLASQEENNFLGKVIQIKLSSNLNKIESKIQYAKGLRNPQGLTLLNGNIYTIEHGPKGGDEINLINYQKNYGWPYFSYGTEYEPPYKKFGSRKSDFVEPIWHFTPSVAPGGLEACSEFFSDIGYQPCLLVAQMRGLGFSIIKLSPDGDYVQSEEKISVGSRVRKISVFGSSIFLFTDNHEIFEVKYSPMQ